MITPRGFSNVRLDVQAGALTVVPLPVETLVHGGWEPLEYVWPTVVLETLRPFMMTSVLVDVHGSLGFCDVLRGAPLREALTAAGFDVVHIERWGAPRRVRRSEVGDRFDRIPQFAREPSIA